MIAQYADLAFLVLTVPLAVWIAYSDLKYMKIPNRLVLALVAIFVVSGVILLPFGDYMWRFLGGFIVLAIGFTMFAIGGFGGGDAKYAAAIALFIPFHHAGLAIFITSIAALLAVYIHRSFRSFEFAKPLTENWKSWTAGRNFPLGLGLSGGFIFYMALQAF